MLVAACDDNLLGKTFREGKLKLEVDRKFYGEDLSTIEEVMAAIQKADIANLVGVRVVESAVKKGLVDRQAVITIAGIPHVQIVKI
jgi:hypothetical protein